MGQEFWVTDMKKVVIVLLILVSLFTTIVFTSCKDGRAKDVGLWAVGGWPAVLIDDAVEKKKDEDKNYEVVKSSFSFGYDGQHFSPNIEFLVGETIYMAVNIKINCYDKNKNPVGTDEVQFSLFIPNHDSLDVYYYDGPSSVVTDTIAGNTAYTYTIGTNSEKAEGERLIFKLIPKEVGSIRLDLTFADPVSQEYNTFKVLDFVDGE